MPLYTFSCGKKSQDIFYNSKDVPSIGSEIIIDGKTWVRVATIPNYAIDEISKINPFDEKDFIKRTANHKGNMGELFDLSQQLSDQREEIAGKDNIGLKYQEEKAKKMENRRAANKRNKQQQAKINKLKNNVFIITIFIIFICWWLDLCIFFLN